MKIIIWIGIFIVAALAIVGLVFLRSQSLPPIQIDKPETTVAEAPNVENVIQPLPPELEAALGAATPTMLPFVLVGTIVRPEIKDSIATLKITNEGLSEIYQADAEIAHVAKILLIVREKVIFKNERTGKVEYFQIGPFEPSHGPSAAGINNSNGASEFHVQRASIDQALSNLPELLSKARAVPLMSETGTIEGYKITDIAKGSIFETIGLVDGDILSAVEGESIRGPSEAMKLFNQLRDSSMIHLSIERNGQRHEVTYLIR